MPEKVVQLAFASGLLFLSLACVETGEVFMKLITIFLIIYGIKLIAWLFRKLYNPRLTEAAREHYVSTCLRSKGFEDFKFDEEGIIDFSGHGLFARYIVHEVEDVPGAILVEFRVHPSTSRLFAVSSRAYVFIRDVAHLKWIQEGLAAVESAHSAFSQALKGGCVEYELAAIQTKLDGLGVPRSSEEEESVSA